VGHRLMAAGEYQLALDAYTRAAGQQGLNVDTLSALGSANLRLGRLGQAEELLRRAVDDDPSFAAAWNNLGVILMERGKIPEASQVFRRAFATDNGNSDQIRDNLRLALAKLDNPDYINPNEDQEFELVRRGTGDYVILSAP
ncbi:MAG: tetratricopeptide repeat protein, partial [Octadecabacter sp.]